MPRSSPAGQGGEGVFRRCNLTGSTASADNANPALATNPIRILFARLALGMMGKVLRAILRSAKSTRGFGVLGVAFASLAASFAHANSDPLSELPAGSTGMAGTLQPTSSPYRGARAQGDYLPPFVYEGVHLYLHRYTLRPELGSG